MKTNYLDVYLLHWQNRILNSIQLNNLYITINKINIRTTETLIGICIIFLDYLNLILRASKENFLICYRLAYLNW